MMLGLDVNRLEEVRQAINMEDRMTEMFSFPPPKTPKTPRFDPSNPFRDDTSPALPAAALATLTSALTIREADKVDVLLRVKFKLDPCQRLLHFELDLVPGVQKGLKVSQAVLSIFGCALLGPGLLRHMPAVRSVLIGLVVSRISKEPGQERVMASQNAQLTAGMKRAAQGKLDLNLGGLRGSPPSTTTSQSKGKGKGRSTLTIDSTHSPDILIDNSEIVIQDIRLARDVPHFEKGGAPFSVSRYFKDSEFMTSCFQSNAF
jgi:hypothetical protein